jgi:hypothetical protein
MGLVRVMWFALPKPNNLKSLTNCEFTSTTLQLEVSRTTPLHPGTCRLSLVTKYNASHGCRDLAGVRIFCMSGIKEDKIRVKRRMR